MTAPAFHGNPLLWMWVRPRGVVRARIEAGPRWTMYLLPIIATTSNVMDRAATQSFGDRMSTPAIVLASVLIGCVFGVLFTWLVGWLVGVTGRSLGGRGTARDVRIAHCWATVPYVWMVATWIPTFLLVGDEIFRSEMPSIEAEPWKGLVFLVMLPIGLVALVWTTVISAKAVGEAHRFSAWRGLGANIYAAILLLGAAIAAVIVVFAALSL